MLVALLKTRLRFPLLRQLKEQAFLWFLIKPGVDARRVVKKAAKSQHHMFDHRFEMTTGRVIETIFEVGTSITAT